MESLVYILKLKNQKYYIGKTKNLQRRIEDHKNGVGSVWTKVHPIVKLKEYYENNNVEFLELAKTLEYMKRYGIENVRGADYCNLILSTDQIKEIKNHLKHQENRCFKCGNTGHFIRDCKGSMVEQKVDTTVKTTVEPKVVPITCLQKIRNILVRFWEFGRKD